MPNATFLAETPYIVVFRVINPSFNQEDQPIYLEAGGADPTLIFIRMPRVRMALGHSPTKLGKTLGIGAQFSR
jgi:hypothetical protein